ncbi:hypothetical protein EJ05DRAFT_483402 [Pseudovirgaria hyperparasitica]|uniref:Ubiquitin 3 binding protein But2 C-terminal domain-containing protein n=1 Tax=Pseudovirgaria hyperparasitica TaxID=470096 RepID=A0A6A6WG98_9PEZI|nr:uncharacterized protein EJ05DRAFT_483402 [Pseudovirgaria hyperparasitica]KAF2760976.1 hypothetical protein EJ05DRAFT_483402 [Pseudovirgaria hyperparasitica]
MPSSTLILSLLTLLPLALATPLAALTPLAPIDPLDPSHAADVHSRSSVRPCTVGTAFAPVHVIPVTGSVVELRYPGLPEGGRVCKVLLDKLPSGVSADGSFACRQTIRLDLKGSEMNGEDVIVRVCDN